MFLINIPEQFFTSVQIGVEDHWRKAVGTIIIKASVKLLLKKKKVLYTLLGFFSSQEFTQVT